MENAPKKILIIDDDSFLLDMYGLKFKQSGFETETALGSTMAYDKMKTGYTPDIILLDLIMPIMDGFELMEKMNTEKLAPSAVRIVLSNRGQEEDITRARGLGATGFIIKASSTPAEVIDKVKEIITNAQ